MFVPIEIYLNTENIHYSSLLFSDRENLQFCYSISLKITVKNLFYFTYKYYIAYSSFKLQCM